MLNVRNGAHETTTGQSTSALSPVAEALQGSTARSFSTPLICSNLTGGDRGGTRDSCACSVGYSLHPLQSLVQSL